MCRNTTLHIINGDGAGNCLLESDILGDVLVCRDLLYDGIRVPGWPNDASLLARSQFLSHLTGGGLSSASILKTLTNQYHELASGAQYENVVLWFDACLCDQSMLAHILVCLKHLGLANVELLCVNSFPGVEPFNGLGQLKPFQLESLFGKRCRVTKAQFRFAQIVEKAFATQDLVLLSDLSQEVDAPLPFIPAAAERWLQEQPDPETGLGRLESLTLNAICKGSKTPGEIFLRVAEDEVSPQFWGDTILWQTINGLAERESPLVHIKGPVERLPQWESPIKLNLFEITISSSYEGLKEVE